MVLNCILTHRYDFCEKYQSTLRTGCGAVERWYCRYRDGRSPMAVRYKAGMWKFISAPEQMRRRIRTSYWYKTKRMLVARRMPWRSKSGKADRGGRGRCSGSQRRLGGWATGSRRSETQKKHHWKMVSKVAGDVDTHQEPAIVDVVNPRSLRKSPAKKMEDEDRLIFQSGWYPFLIRVVQ